MAGGGSFIPERILDNAELERMVDTSDEWITVRTGIKERRIASDGETTASMGAAAAKDALDEAGIAPGEVDQIICATFTPDLSLPAAACLIQRNLGAVNASAFDLAAACSGWIYALDTAAAAIETGRARTIVVVGAETLSRVTDYQDRSSCILFGDGAGAVVLRKANPGEQAGICYTCLGADGAQWNLLQIPGGGSAKPLSKDVLDNREHYLKLRGREVYKFAVMKMQWLIRDAMSACELGVDDVAMIVPHQVNKRIIDSAVDRLGLPEEKFALNLEKYGNTSSASVPIALEEVRRDGRVKAGDIVILVAFGGGLTWASAVVKL